MFLLLVIVVVTNVCNSYGNSFLKKLFRSHWQSLDLTVNQQDLRCATAGAPTSTTTVLTLQAILLLWPCNSNTQENQLKKEQPNQSHKNNNYGNYNNNKTNINIKNKNNSKKIKTSMGYNWSNYHGVSANMEPSLSYIINISFSEAFYEDCHGYPWAYSIRVHYDHL